MFHVEHCTHAVWNVLHGGMQCNWTGQADKAQRHKLETQSPLAISAALTEFALSLLSGRYSAACVRMALFTLSSDALSATNFAYSSEPKASGTAITATIAGIAETTINAMSVNPCLFFKDCNRTAKEETKEKMFHVEHCTHAV